MILHFLFDRDGQKLQLIGEKTALPKKLLTLFVLLGLLILCLPVPAFAQSPGTSDNVGLIDWRELKTEKFLSQNQIPKSDI